MRKWFEGALLLFTTTCLAALSTSCQTLSGSSEMAGHGVNAGHAVGQEEFPQGSFRDQPDSAAEAEVPTSGEQRAAVEDDDIQAGHAVGQRDIPEGEPAEVATAGETGPQEEVEAGHTVGMNWHPHDRRAREAPKTAEADDAKTAPPAAAAQIGRKTECGKIVIGESEHAVGDPCMTTDKFMVQLGLDADQRQGVFELVEHVGKPSRVERTGE